MMANLPMHYFMDFKRTVGDDSDKAGLSCQRAIESTACNVPIRGHNGTPAAGQICLPDTDTIQNAAPFSGATFLANFPGTGFLPIHPNDKMRTDANQDCGGSPETMLAISPCGHKIDTRCPA